MLQTVLGLDKLSKFDYYGRPLQEMFAKGRLPTSKDDPYVD
jgi:hypothetical protein